MGVVMAMSECVNCHRLFSYHPHKVPSVRTASGREPLCKTCVEWANPKRIAKGLPPIDVLPGAYEPIPEEEL